MFKHTSSRDVSLISLSVIAAGREKGKRNLQTCAVSKHRSSPLYLGHVLAEYHVLGLTQTQVLDMCSSFVKGNLIRCQPCVIIRLSGMLSLIHVELLRRETKSIYLYSDGDAKPETVSH